MEGKVSHNITKADLNPIFEEMGITENVNDKTLGGALEVGMKLYDFRFGLEGYYNEKTEDILHKIDLCLPVEFESKGLFLNGYYDFQLSNKIKPFIGAGVGYSWLKGSLAIFSVTDKDFGWHLGAGVGYELNQNFDLSLDYKYENLGKIKVADDSIAEVTNHKVSLGLRYTF